MKYTLTTLALAAVTLASPAPSVAPSSFKIANVVSGGSGCPQGSIDIDWTDQKVLPICKYLRNISQQQSAQSGRLIPLFISETILMIR